jgi:riboflavin kinase/FMN adenylyltransferase
MIINKGYENISFQSPIVTMGIFDGVHCGHATLLNYFVDIAKDSDRESVVITFISPYSRNSCLTTPDEKREILSKKGIDHLVEIDLDEEFKKIKAVDFIKNVLVDKINAKHIVIGYDQSFGHGGEGNFETLRQYSADFGFTVEQVPEFRLEGNKISSSVIKKLLLAGDLDKANRLLGYNYKMSGTVIEGKKIGRKLGFPTANILPDKNKLIPAGGVYAVEVETKFGYFTGMLSIGINPTINPSNSEISIEVNIFDFNQDIYNQKISVVFKKRLRDEKQFNNIEQLVSQMKLDREETLNVFS